MLLKLNNKMPIIKLLNGRYSDVNSGLYTSYLTGACKLLGLGLLYAINFFHGSRIFLISKVILDSKRPFGCMEDYSHLFS